MSSKKYRRFDNYLLKGRLRRNGFERTRYVFTGINKASGIQRTFFIELYYVNPLVSPKEPVIAQKNRPVITDASLQYALSMVSSMDTAEDSQNVLPSYALVRAGIYGAKGKYLNSFNPSSSLAFVKSEGAFKTGDCVFGRDAISGKIELTDNDLLEHPEFLCSPGAISWNLRFEKIIEAPPMYCGKSIFWMPGGAKTVFAGIVKVDGTEYSVVPRSSSGYIDKSWGEEPADPFFHLSSSNLVSAITGKPALKSCFSVEGEFDKRLSIFAEIEGKKIALGGKSLFSKYTEVHSWTEMPADGDGEKLHWTLSVHRKKLVIDMDIYCRTVDMLVRDYEVPQGDRKVLKVLGGGTGFGEIKVFKKTGKNLELLEHLNVLDSLCEYGSIDKTEE